MKVGAMASPVHDAFRLRIGKVARLAGGPDRKEACALFVALRRAVAEHEKAEEDLLQSAYLDDLGGYR